MDSKKILIVDDEDTILITLAEYLRSEGYEAVSASSATEGKMAVDETDFAAALVDIFMPDGSGLELLSRIKERSPDTECIIMTSRASLDTAVDAIRKGAYAYLEKPFENIDEVGILLEKALDKRRLVLENKSLVEQLTRRNEELVIALNRKSSLIEVGRALSSIHTISDLLNYFIEVVVAQMKVNRASLMLIDEEGQDLRIAASHGLEPEIVASTKIKLGEGIAGMVAKSGKAILVKDVKSDPLTRNTERLAATSDSFISSPIVLSIPITLKDSTLGVINLTDKLSEEAFNEDDLDFLYGLAGQAAVAIDSARQMEEVKRSYSELRETHRQLVASERLNALGQMAAGIAHDFNNILNGILARIEYLKIKDSQPDERELFRDELAMIENLTLQGAETVRRIQEFTGLRKDQPESSVQINEVVQKTLEMTRPKWSGELQAKGATIEVRTRLTQVPPTLGKEYELIQLLSNLIFNAVEAMPDGGILELRSGVEQEMIAIEVLDTGTGMDEEQKARLFEPFFSTRSKGRGLGGSIAYGIVNRYGGQLLVNSEPGKGTKIRVLLPVLEFPVAPDVKKEARSALQRSSGHILLVEDDETNLASLERNLKLLGYSVDTATSGSEALAYFDGTRTYDVVITDLSMPGLSGLDLARELHREHPELPLILLSGFSVHLDSSEVSGAGIVHILSKPCQLNDIQTAIEKVKPASSS